MYYRLYESKIGEAFTYTECYITPSDRAGAYSASDIDAKKYENLINLAYFTKILN